MKQEIGQRAVGFTTSIPRFMQLKRIGREREMSVSEVIRQSIKDVLGPITDSDRAAAVIYAQEMEMSND